MSKGTLLGEVDLYLLGEGRHERLWEQLGAHLAAEGVEFAVWAPNARGVSVVGDWNYWSENADPLVAQGSSGVWAGIAPNAREGQRYKLAVRGADGITRLKADPFAFRAEVPPDNASVVHRSSHVWTDDAWLARRAETDPLWRPCPSTRSMPARGVQGWAGATSPTSSATTSSGSGSLTSS